MAAVVCNGSHFYLLRCRRGNHTSDQPIKNPVTLTLQGRIFKVIELLLQTLGVNLANKFNFIATVVFGTV